MSHDPTRIFSRTNINQGMLRTIEVNMFFTHSLTYLIIIIKLGGATVYQTVTIIVYFICVFQTERELGG